MSNITYEQVSIEFGSDFIKRANQDGSVTFIPIDETNKDYTEYLASLEETAE